MQIAEQKNMHFYSKLMSFLKHIMTCPLAFSIRHNLNNCIKTECRQQEQQCNRIIMKCMYVVPCGTHARGWLGRAYASYAWV